MKEKIRFEDFLLEVNPANLDFVAQLHEFLLNNGCAVNIESAKSGYVVFYSYTKTKKAVANYVFRKKGLIARIYGNHVSNYMDFINTLPDEMIKSIEKASVCRRLVNPEKCNSRCAMGYTFTLNGIEYQKCRHNSFMFLLNDENNPYIKMFLEHELSERSA